MLDMAAPARANRGGHRAFLVLWCWSARSMKTLARTDARYGLDVFWKAFLANRAGYRVGIPTVPLGDLYEGCRGAIEQRGGEVALRARRCAAFKLRITGLRASHSTAAARKPPTFTCLRRRTTRCSSFRPNEVTRMNQRFNNLRRLRVSPITGVHFWFDRQVMSEPFLTLGRSYDAMDIQ